MADPITLAVIGSAALTEGIKFLYGQAGEVLKVWRERRGKPAQETDGKIDDTAPADVSLPAAVFEGQLTNPVIHFAAVQETEQQLRELRKDLFEYVDGTESIDTQDSPLLERVDALRQLLEAVYQQRLTFKGEQRPASGPIVEGHIDVKVVAGYAAAVRAKQIASGHIIGEAKADRVEPGGQLIGVDASELIGNLPQ